MRVLVCGGRNYGRQDDVQHVFDELDAINARTPIAAIIEGGASGADLSARIWAQESNIKCVTVIANWAEHGKAAGPIRNRRMLVDFKPDLVVAFPGGLGTADMVRQAAAAGVEVRRTIRRTTRGKGASQ